MIHYHISMDEMGGLDIGVPSEGEGGVSEEAREQARQRFAGAQAALQQLQREEKKSKKRDDGVAQAILQFLTDTQRTHLATLISRLVSLNCPSPFILSILSLINDGCRTVVEEYLRDQQIDIPEIEGGSRSVLPADSALESSANDSLAAWITRMELTLQSDEEKILRAIVVEDSNIDGTVLQLTTFVLEEFLTSQGKKPAFDQLQQLSAHVLQSLFQGAMQGHMERRLAEAHTEEE